MSEEDKVFCEEYETACNKYTALNSIQYSLNEQGRKDFEDLGYFIKRNLDRFLELNP